MTECDFLLWQGAQLYLIGVDASMWLCVCALDYRDARVRRSGYTHVNLCENINAKEFLLLTDAAVSARGRLSNGGSGGCTTVVSSKLTCCMRLDDDAVLQDRVEGLRQREKK